MNAEHVKVLEQMRKLLTDWGETERTAALDAAIAALKAFDAEPDADLELIWHSVSDSAETNAAYRRLKARLAALNPERRDPVEPGSYWQHRNGNVYRVLYVTNTAVRREGHPPDVVYQGENGHVWSRALSDWYRCFTKHATPPTKESANG